jgi:glutamyl-tRNA synthetase
MVDRARAIEIFDIAGIGRSPARTDQKKLENLNGHYIRAANDERLVALTVPFVEAKIGRELTEKDRDLLHRSMAVLKVRARDLLELADGSTFLFRTRPLDVEDRAQALLTGDGAALLAAAVSALEPTEWTADALDTAVRGVAETAGVGLGKVAQPLRAALTGRTTSPGIFDVLLLLGKDESLARLADQLAGTN